MNVTFKDSVLHSGRAYKVGDTATLPDQQAYQLVVSGAAEPGDRLARKRVDELGGLPKPKAAAPEQSPYAPMLTPILRDPAVAAAARAAHNQAMSDATRERKQNSLARLLKGGRNV
ncbi:hypothetical protein [Xylophilus ampelinus]|uniref:Uncharacterized protein n=1 Tax=Xylophilus ampelinus TaxID=54067 RepID=A0A318SRF1_9BURK|nr:hypothetical protein [Xylophilus ampelinus]MCS4511131.1 hypothetical protein [Xylophilus ampelinus]PYE75879.1 hypothetical protein DFQ15_1184 [Xylophilus ampelinus]